MPEPTRVDKRILLIPTTGLRAGISIICGTESQLKDALKSSELADFIPEVSFGDHSGPACLVKVGTRFIEYHEVTTPDSYGSTHPEQQ